MTATATGVQASTRNSERLFAEALELLPGGVDSPARAFKAVGGTPRFIESGRGAFITDVDGRQYVDYVLSFGPHILGHAPDEVVDAIRAVAAHGVSFGAPVEGELILARDIRAAMPSIEMVRFVNSGTEAVMSALRLARAFTGRDVVVKFEGHYHGHADQMLARAGSGVATLGLPDSPGVPASAAAHTITVPFNDPDAITRLFKTRGDAIAAVILEGVSGNMGVVPSMPGFVRELRALTTRAGALLIMDEVMTGFRAHHGGAQALLGVTPDLTTLGKVIGGGLPVGAYGGRRDIMSLVAPAGPVYQAGTMSGNPLTMAAGHAVLAALREPGRWDRIAATTATLAEGLRESATRAGIAVQVPQVGTMLSVFFSDTPVVDLASATRSNTESFKKFFHAMLDDGIYLPPSPFESWFLSEAHDAAVIERTLRAADRAFAAARS